MYIYERKVYFYETDMMGIVHHANYVRMLEEARVAWAQAQGLLSDPQDAARLAVLSVQVQHRKPLRFGDTIRVEVQARLVQVRIEFEYKVWNASTLVAEGRTTHVGLLEGRVVRPSPAIKKALEEYPWKETWLSNLSE